MKNKRTLKAASVLLGVTGVAAILFTLSGCNKPAPITEAQKQDVRQKVEDHIRDDKPK